jgi:hypothetical protein
MEVDTKVVLEIVFGKDQENTEIMMAVVMKGTMNRANIMGLEK